jgi:hypothetical protein
VSWEISDDEVRASFEVVRVADLPAVSRADIPVVSAEGKPCGCYWCEPDWRAIAAVSVQILEEGTDPLDHNALSTRAEELGLSADERGWLHGLFSPGAAIIVLRDSRQFMNGMHRIHALRMAGVERCVVYTGRGELPYEE